MDGGERDDLRHQGEHQHPGWHQLDKREGISKLKLSDFFNDYLPVLKVNYIQSSGVVHSSRRCDISSFCPKSQGHSKSKNFISSFKNHV